MLRHELNRNASLRVNTRGIANKDQAKELKRSDQLEKLSGNEPQHGENWDAPARIKPECLVTSKHEKDRGQRSSEQIERKNISYSHFGNINGIGNYELRGGWKFNRK